MVSKNSKLIKKRNQKSKKDKNKNKVVKSLKINNKRKTTKSNKKIKKITKKTKKNKRYKSQIGGTLSDQSVMGIEIEVCIHPVHRDTIKKKMEQIENEIQTNQKSKETYGEPYKYWEHVTEDCECPGDDKWGKFNFEDNKVYNNEDLSRDYIDGTEFASPKLNTYKQIVNYVNLFDKLFDENNNKPRAITVKKCGIHIHWSNKKFDLKKIIDDKTKLFYKFHFMRIFYILERYFYKHLSEREIHGINGIYHTKRQFRGISPVRYFNPSPKDLDSMQINDITTLPNYWIPNNPETAFNTFNQFPNKPEDILKLNLYRPNKILKIITKSFDAYMIIRKILVDDYTIRQLKNLLTDIKNNIKMEKNEQTTNSNNRQELLEEYLNKLVKTNKVEAHVKKIIIDEFVNFCKMEEAENYEVNIPDNIDEKMDRLKNTLLYEKDIMIIFDFEPVSFSNLYKIDAEKPPLINPLKGRNMIKFYDDKDMHIEFRFFANTNLENKKKYKERLLYLFEVCDKICYNVGLGIQELLKNDGSPKNQDLINKLQPNFFDKLTSDKMVNDNQTTEDKEKKVFDLLIKRN